MLFMKLKYKLEATVFSGFAEIVPPWRVIAFLQLKVQVRPTGFSGSAFHLLCKTAQKFEAGVFIRNPDSGVGK